MEIYKASVVKEDEHHYLQLSLKEKVLKIALTKDNPNDIKKVFNELIVELKKGKFEFNEEEDVKYLSHGVYAPKL